MALAQRDIIKNYNIKLDYSQIKPNLPEKEHIKFLLGTIIGLILISFVLYYHTVIVENSLNQKQNTIIKIQEQNYILQNQLSQLQALDIIDKQAVEKLQMIEPNNITYLHVPSAIINKENKKEIKKNFNNFKVITPIGY